MAERLSHRPRNVLVFTTADPCGGRLVRGMVAYLREHGSAWTTRITYPHDWSASALEDWPVDGILGFWSGPRPELASLLANPAVKVVNTSLFALQDRFPCVHMDELAGARRCVSHLKERGFSRIAWVGDEDNSSSQQRGLMVEQAVHEAGLEPLRWFWFPNGAKFRARELAVARLGKALQELEPPTGIIAFNDLMGSIVIQACREAQRAIPRELAVLGVDDDAEICLLADPPLSSLITPAPHVAYRAAELLDALMNGAPQPERPILLPPAGFTLRRSTDTVAFADQDIGRAVSYIRQHLREPISVEQVLQATQTISRPTFFKRFVAATGMMPLEAIHRCRIELVKSRLIDTSWPLEQIASQSGFLSASVLCRVFRKYERLTPIQYRQKHRPLR